MRGLVPFRDDDYDHENRPPQLPALFEYEGIHPQHPVKLEGCKTLVYLVDPSPEGKARAVRISQAQRVPGIISALPGLLKLKPGYAVLARPITQGGDPNDDCLQVLVSIEFERTLTTRMQQLCRGEYTHEKIVELMDNVKKARDELLGRRDERKKHKVAMFELDDRAKPLTNGPRCYPVNNLVQRSRGIEGPPAALKTYNNTTDDYQEMMRRFVFAITAINIAAMELQGPPGMLTAAKDYGEQVNTPRLGHDRNYHWASQQLNVASARRPAASARDFKTDQGHFSEPHIDKHDLSQGLSAANSIGDTPDDNGCDPGRFHFIGLGVYVELVYGLQIFFSGLLYHGGTPPLIPSPQRIHGWEIRMFVISYPASTILTGEARHSYGSIPYSKDPEFVSPEITGAPTYIREAPVAPLYTNCATIAQDGGVVMPRRSHVNWIVRAALQKLHYTLRQLPPEYGIQIDADSFTDSVKFLSEEDGPDGNLVTADRWALAPDSDVQHPYSARHKQAQDAFLKAENDRLIRGLPTIADNRHSSWDILSLEFNGRPKKSATAKRKRPAVDTPAKPEQSKRPCTRNIARSHVRVNASNTFPMASQPTWRIPNIVVDSHSPSRAQNDSTESPNQQKEQVEPSVGASSSNDLAQTSSAPHTHNTLCTDRETSGQTRRQGDANRAYVLVPPSRLLQHNVSGQKHRVPEGDGGQQGAVVVADPDGGHENEHAASIPPASLSLRSHRCKTRR
ncbi:hypothetical protein BC629DRAFT_1231321 [Irpex lacteus]|nr:hypothetical protein BC629DRAFT_1231321 [Irpex lacteus]